MTDRKASTGSPVASTLVPMAWLFIIGSALFALGAIPGYADAVGLSADAATFFLGSIFFTSAGFLQYRAAVADLPEAQRAGRRVWVWAPRDLNWVASAVQLAGTLWFNWSTGNALGHNLTAATEDARIWRPDVLGSIAFLIASGLGSVLARREFLRDGRRSRDWWSATLNLLGSIAFGVSAIAAYVVPATDNDRNAELSNLGTLIGALCFLVGAAVLLPPRAATRAASPSGP